MTLQELLDHGTPPLMAILRGMKPAEAADIGRTLVAAGIQLIEVPLNSPQPLDSIARLQSACGGDALVGAGTVLTCDAVEQAAAAGARFIVTPNTDTAVIRHAVARSLEPLPGFFTASEAFAALAAGARRLKLFPASSAAPDHIKSLRDVLPQGTPIWAVGGTNAGNLADWLRRGAEGLGVGGALYRPGDAAGTVGDRARALVSAWAAARS